MIQDHWTSIKINVSLSKTFTNIDVKLDNWVLWLLISVCDPPQSSQFILKRVKWLTCMRNEYLNFYICGLSRLQCIILDVERRVHTVFIFIRTRCCKGKIQEVPPPFFSWKERGKHLVKVNHRIMRSWQHIGTLIISGWI